jgi:hypothetical protein
MNGEKMKKVVVIIAAISSFAVVAGEISTTKCTTKCMISYEPNTDVLVLSNEIATPEMASDGNCLDIVKSYATTRINGRLVTGVKVNYKNSPSTD